MPEPNRGFCITCQKPIPSYRRKDAKYCREECAYKKYYQPHSTGLATATTGAISELKVAADLLGKKYEVFRALSPSCSCDLAVLQNHKLLTVEVRTGRPNKYGEIIPYDRRYNADILATVSGDTIIYKPNLPSGS